MNSVPPEKSNPEPVERDLFLVLDGGGARGIAHVGAWRALRRLVARPGESFDEQALKGLGPVRYRLRGIAGTSAGAVAAAFIAAGADPNELIDETGRVPLCAALHVGYFLDIFGIRGWRRLKFIRLFLAPSAWLRGAIEKLRGDVEAADHPDLHEMMSAERGLRLVNSNPESPPVEEPRTTRPLKSAFERNLVMLSILGGMIVFYIPELVSLLIPYNVSAPFFTLFLWAALNISFLSTGQIARQIERRRSQSLRRTYSNLERGLLHPGAAILYALILATLVSILAKWLYFNDHPLPLDSGATAAQTAKISGADVLENFVWALCGGLFGLSLGHFVRRVLKGGIAPEIMQKDIETALRFLLRNKCDGWDTTTEKHVWNARQTDSQFIQTLGDRPIEQPITFKELFDATKIHLTVVAADTIQNEVLTFSATNHPNKSVALAVSASMAIPLIFRPVRDGPRLLVDGGIVSSIPAWVFRRHRNRDPDCRILAIRIELGQFDDWIPLLRRYREIYAQRLREKGWPHVGKALFWFRYPRLSLRWPRALFTNILSTAAFGARALELDASDRLDSFPLAPNVGLLDFDLEPAIVKAELDRLQDQAHNEIVNVLYDRAKVFDDVCNKIASVIRRIDIVGERPQNAGTLRMFWAARDGDADSVRIKFTSSFDPKRHFDDRLVMPFGTSMSAWAMESGRSQFAKREVLTKLLSGTINRYRLVVKWDKIAWCWAIPIRDPKDSASKVIGILAIESDLSLASFNKSVGDEGDRRSDRWLDFSAGRELQKQEDLAIAAKSSDVRGRMKTWEQDFAVLMWNEFAAAPTKSKFAKAIDTAGDGEKGA